MFADTDVFVDAIGCIQCFGAIYATPSIGGFGNGYYIPSDFHGGNAFVNFFMVSHERLARCKGFLAAVLFALMPEIVH
jgi:hypothetical protein